MEQTMPLSLTNPILITENPILITENPILITEKEKRKTELEGLKQQREKEKEDAEAPEKEALDYYRQLEEEERKKRVSNLCLITKRSHKRL